MSIKLLLKKENDEQERKRVSERKKKEERKKGISALSLVGHGASSIRGAGLPAVSLLQGPRPCLRSPCLPRHALPAPGGWADHHSPTRALPSPPTLLCGFPRQLGSRLLCEPQDRAPFGPVTWCHSSWLPVRLPDDPVRLPERRDTTAFIFEFPAAGTGPAGPGGLRIQVEWKCRCPHEHRPRAPPTNTRPWERPGQTWLLRSPFSFLLYFGK